MRFSVTNGLLNQKLGITLCELDVRGSDMDVVKINSVERDAKDKGASGSQ